MNRRRFIRCTVLSGLAVLTSTGHVGNSRADVPTVPTLVNPGFEADGTGVANPIGWTATGDVNASYTEAGGHSGNWRLSHWSPNAYSVDTIESLNQVENGWYTISAWVRRSTGNNDTYVAFQCGQDVDRTYAPAAWPGQWVQIVASVAARGPSCEIVLHTDADGGEWANFDDVGIVAGPAPLSIAGADVSSLNKSAALGGVYLDDDGGWDPWRFDERAIAPSVSSGSTGSATSDFANG